MGPHGDDVASAHSNHLAQRWAPWLVAASFCCWWAASAAAHCVTAAAWPRYRGLPRLARRQWCNKLASGLHAALVAAGGAATLRHPAVAVDPLRGTCAGHYVWSAVLAGYLLYDTAYSLAFYPLAGAAPFLAHHALGLVGAALGLGLGVLGAPGAALCALLEGTTPLLHVLGCMRLAGLQEGRLYRLLGKAFVAQYFLFRVVGANAYLARFAAVVVASPHRPWWAWAGLAVFASLSALSLLWFVKLVRIVRGGAAAARPPAAPPAALPGQRSVGGQDEGLIKPAGRAAAPQQIRIRAFAPVRRGAGSAAVA